MFVSVPHYHTLRSLIRTNKQNIARCSMEFRHLLHCSTFSTCLHVRLLLRIPAWKIYGKTSKSLLNKKLCVFMCSSAVVCTYVPAPSLSCNVHELFLPFTRVSAKCLNRMTCERIRMCIYGREKG